MKPTRLRQRITKIVPATFQRFRDRHKSMLISVDLISVRLLKRSGQVLSEPLALYCDGSSWYIANDVDGWTLTKRSAGSLEIVNRPLAQSILKTYGRTELTRFRLDPVRGDRGLYRLSPITTNTEKNGDDNENDSADQQLSAHNGRA